MEENRFITAARDGKNDFWRYFLTVILISLGFLLGGACLLVLTGLVTGSLDFFSMPPELFLAINLAPFFVILGGLWVALRLFHRRPFFSLISPARPFSWKRFFLSAGIWGLVSLVSDVILAFLQPGNYVFAFEPARLIPWVVVAVLLLPFQCAAEELFFRGYLTQGLGLLGGTWLAWLAPSLLFGLLHGANPEVGAYGIFLTLPLYIGTGLLLGWITLRSESLELALGLHVANNLYSALLVTFPSSVLPAPALFRIQNYNGVATLAAFAVMVLVYLILLGGFGRGYFRNGLWLKRS